MTTSARAAADPRNLLRWGSQRHRLLEVYKNCRRKAGLSDEEAAVNADLFLVGTMFWARCAELRNLGLIEEAGETVSRMGNAVKTCRITKTGIETLAAMRAGRKAA